MNNDIGRIVEVRGIDVKAKLFRLLPPYLINNGKVVSAPKINSYVKTKVGLDTIICQVTGEYNVDQNNNNANDYYLDLKVRGYIDRGKFIQGLRMLPIVSSNLSLLSNKDYSIIFDYNRSNSFKIGKDLFEIEKELCLNFNNLIPSHVGIFGNTGSGKSNTLTNIYSHYLKKINKYKTENAKVILFDLNNEYGNDSITDLKFKTIYNLTTRSKSKLKIPFDFNKIDEDEMCIILNASAKTQIPTIKNAFKNMKEEHNKDYYLSYVKSIIMNNQRELFYALRFRLSEYIENVESIKWFNKADNQKFYIEISENIWLFNDKEGFKKDVLDKIDIKIPDNPLDRFKFELCFAIIRESERGINSDYLLPLLYRADKLFKDFEKVFDFNSNGNLFDNNHLAIVQLGNVNNDMKMIIPSLLSNMLFQQQISNKGDDAIKSIINIVIDEAHNILFKEDDSTIHNYALEQFEKVVKEGRKFGVYLTLSSQRPSDISNTVLSQLHNYFIHKLVNPNDLNQIRKAVAFLDENALNFLTILAPGECILSGTVVNMPVFIKVDELDEDTKPNSNNLILFGEHGIIENSEDSVR